MTNRNGRDPDHIVSVGGSLRVIGGAYARGQQSAFQGPVSLPIGFGFQSAGDVGAHLDVGVVDLGRYVAFDGGGRVAKPDLAAVLSPSISGGIFFGKEFPFTVAATFGYAPHYQFAAEGERGAFTFGMSVGVYVPLLDLN